MSIDKDTLFSILVGIKEVYFQEQIYEQQIQNQFKLFCNPQNQRLDSSLFKKFIQNKTDGITDGQIAELFKMFDKNRSGTISLDEFKQIFIQIRYAKSSDVQKMIQTRPQIYQSSDQGNHQFIPMYNQAAGGRVDLQPQITMNQQGYSQGNGYPQIQGYPNNQFVPINPLIDQSPQVNQQKNKYPEIFGSPQNIQQQQTNSPYNQNTNQQQMSYPNSQKNTNNQPPPSNLVNQQQQQQQQQQKQNAGSNSQKYPDLVKKNNDSDQNRDIVNQLIGNQDNQNIIQLKDEDRIVQQLVTETPFQTLMQKLADLKDKHQQKQINLLTLKNVSNNKKVSFRDLVKYIGLNGVQFTQPEENVLKAYLTDKNSDTVYIKEFLDLLCLKDINQDPPPNMPNYNNNNNKINYPQLNINQAQNNSPQNLPAQQPNKIQNNNANIVAQLLNPQNNNVNNNQRLEVNNKIQGMEQSIDVMRSSIQTRNLYEIDREGQLKDFDKFVMKFKQCQQSNQQFTDSEFKPNSDSIIKDATFRKYNDWIQLKWLRPSQFFGSQQYQMFTKIDSMNTSRIGLGKLISPNDIQQGMLGDCYFLSALSSLAQEPKRILNLFITRVKNDFGIYCVKFCFDGEWQAIYVDDQIPCKYDKPAFTKSNENELWVLVLEKAWAKLFKSYYAIEAGYCREALRDLTGAPTKTAMTVEQEVDETGKLVKRDNDGLILMLKDALSKTNKFVVTAGADDEDDLTRSTADRIGLVNSHAYSIIGVKEINHPRLGSVTLVRLRNPWGSQEWKGDWSDNSNLWTPELKEALRIKNKDDGIFYMSVKDFMKYFDDVCFCYYHDDFQYSSIRIPQQRNSKSSSYIALRVEVQGTYYISIIQPNKRNYIDQNIKFKYSISRLFLSQITDSYGKPCIKYIGASQKRDREIFIECNLSPGAYIIQSKVFWETNLNNTYVVSSYGVAKTQFKMIDKKSIPPFIDECLLQKARKSTKLKPLRSYPDIMKETLLESKEGYGYYYIKNNSNQTLDMEVNFKSSMSIKLKKPWRMPILKCVVLPKQEFIAPITVSSLGYSFQSSETYTVS